ncbi:hypothetical protein ACNKHO_10410 [Shigella flexneri]
MYYMSVNIGSLSDAGNAMARREYGRSTAFALSVVGTPITVVGNFPDLASAGLNSTVLT